MIKNLKNNNIIPVNSKEINNIKLNFENIQNKFDYLGFKAQSSKNKLTIEFENEA